MDFLYGAIGAGVVFSLIVAIYKMVKIKQVKNIKEKLKEVGTIKEVKNKTYDVILTVNKKKIYVKILYLGKVKELSINSFRHWQIDSTSKKLNLINTGGFERLKQPKIIIVYPTPERVVKYINENEVVFVKYDEQCFDFYLFTKDEIDKIGNFF